MNAIKEYFENADHWYVDGAADAVDDLAEALEYIRANGGALYAHTGPLCWEPVPSFLVKEWMDAPEVA